jgi:hypothetical protein
MSYSFTRTESDYLSASLTGTQPSSVTVACWVKIPSLGGNYHGLFAYRGTTARLESQMQNNGAGFLRMVNSSSIGVDADTSSTIGTGWSLVIGQFDNAADTLRMYASFGDGSSYSATQSFPGENLNLIEAGRAFGPSHNYLDGKIAHLAIWSGPLSGGDIASLKGGSNPTELSSATLTHYWPLTGDLNAHTGGVNLTNNGAALDSGDNPTVNAPSGGGASLIRVERGAITRGLNRGVS